MHRGPHPRPISSASRQPLYWSERMPIKHSYMKVTPSRWCGRKNLPTYGSTTWHQSVHVGTPEVIGSRASSSGGGRSSKPSATPEIGGWQSSLMKAAWRKACLCTVQHCWHSSMALATLPISTTGSCWCSEVAQRNKCEPVTECWTMFAVKAHHRHHRPARAMQLALAGLPLAGVQNQCARCSWVKQG